MRAFRQDPGFGRGNTTVDERVKVQAPVIRQKTGPWDFEVWFGGSDPSSSKKRTRN